MMSRSRRRIVMNERLFFAREPVPDGRWIAPRPCEEAGMAKLAFSGTRFHLRRAGLPQRC
jgi:hypothetical protein